MVHISWGTSLSIMCSPETSQCHRRFSDDENLRPHTWSLERSTRWLNFLWKLFNYLNVQTSFREVVALGRRNAKNLNLAWRTWMTQIFLWCILCRIRWMRSSRNAWAAAKIGCRDLKKSLGQEDRRGRAQWVWIWWTEELEIRLHRAEYNNCVTRISMRTDGKGRRGPAFLEREHCRFFVGTKESQSLCQVIAEANLRNSPCVRSNYDMTCMHLSSIYPFRMCNSVEF